MDANTRHYAEFLCAKQKARWRTGLQRERNQPVTNNNTTTVTCIENRLTFRIESAFRRTAKLEPNFSRAVHMAQCSLLTQRERFSHEERCEVCLAAEKAIN
jgi:hypothetical protein